MWKEEVEGAGLAPDERDDPAEPKIAHVAASVAVFPATIHHYHRI